MKERLKQIAEYMDEIVGDTSAPRNVRKAVNDAKERLLNEEEDIVMRLTSAIYALDEISNDINMQPYTRTQIWNLIGELEALKEDAKD